MRDESALKEGEKRKKYDALPWSLLYPPFSTFARNQDLDLETFAMTRADSHMQELSSYRFSCCQMGIEIRFLGSP